MKALKCPACGGPLSKDADEQSYCSYCEQPFDGQIKTENQSCSKFKVKSVAVPLIVLASMLIVYFVSSKGERNETSALEQMSAKSDTSQKWKIRGDGDRIIVNFYDKSSDDYYGRVLDDLFSSSASKSKSFELLLEEVKSKLETTGEGVTQKAINEEFALRVFDRVFDRVFSPLYSKLNKLVEDNGVRVDADKLAQTLNFPKLPDSSKEWRRIKEDGDLVIAKFYDNLSTEYFGVVLDDLFSSSASKSKSFELLLEEVKSKLETTGEGVTQKAINEEFALRVFDRVFSPLYSKLNKLVEDNGVRVDADKLAQTLNFPKLPDSSKEWRRIKEDGDLVIAKFYDNLSTEYFGVVLEDLFYPSNPKEEPFKDLAKQAEKEVKKTVKKPSKEQIQEAVVVLMLDKVFSPLYSKLNKVVADNKLGINTGRLAKGIKLPKGGIAYKSLIGHSIGGAALFATVVGANAYIKVSGLTFLGYLGAKISAWWTGTTIAASALTGSAFGPVGAVTGAAVTAGAGYLIYKDQQKKAEAKKKQAYDELIMNVGKTDSDVKNQWLVLVNNLKEMEEKQERKNKTEAHNTLKLAIKGTAADVQTQWLKFIQTLK